MLSITRESDLPYHQLIGQDELKKRLAESFNEGRLLNHAFLFCADQGMGKKTFALSFAKQILCQRQGEQIIEGACGQCSSCRYFDAGTHPDFKWIQREQDKIIKVNRIRKEIISDLQLRPQISQYKVYLLNLDDLNEQGQNALLKSLEEPPAYVVFLLTTTLLNHLLDTIISRVIILNFQRYSTEQIERIFQLKNRAPAESFAIKYANGNPGKALQISGDETFKDLRQEAIDIFFSFPTSNRTVLLTEKLDYLKKMKDQIDIFLNVWQDLLHDLLILLQDTKLTDIQQIDLLARIKRLAEYYRTENIDKEKRRLQLLHSFDAIQEVRMAGNVNASFEGMIGQLLLTLRKDLQING